MSQKLFRPLAVLIVLFSLAGCNFPLSRSALQTAEDSTAAPGLEQQTPATTTEPVANFDPLQIDCLVGTWEVESASMVYAGNMLVGGSGLTLTNVSPTLLFRFLWDEPLLGSTYTMQAWFIDTAITAVYTAGDTEHVLDLTLDGSTTAYFSAGSGAGSFDYQNDPDRATVEISSIKLDGLPIPGGVIPLADLIASLPSGRMFYTCDSPDVITLRDQNAVEPITLRRVSDDVIAE